MPKETTTNLVTNADDTAAKVLSELNALRANNTKLQDQVSQLSDLNARQQSTLTSEAFLNRSAPVAPAQQPEQTAGQKFINQLYSTFETRFNEMKTYIDDSVGQVSTLVKSANPDSPVWSQTKMAEKLIDEGKVNDMQTALKLAQLELNEQAEAAKLDAEQADKDLAALRADQASMGNPDSTSSSSPNAEGKTAAQTMEEEWQASGMEEALESEAKQQDIWDLPSGSSGVRIVD